MELKGLDNCWLSPKGRIVIKDREFWADKAWHQDLALCILRDIWGLTEKLDAFKVVQKTHETATSELEDLKWIRLHCSVKPLWIMPIDRRITKKQELVILEWCMENNTSFDKCFSS